jgi:15-cis-phytoene synthase
MRAVHAPEPSDVPPGMSTEPSPRPAPQAPWPVPGSSLDWSLRVAPPDKRPLLLLWLTWWHETARIPLTIADIGVAQAKLAWWSGALTEASQGRAPHPVLQELISRAGGADKLPPWGWWQDQLTALQDYLQQNRWMDEASRAHHIGRSTAQAAAGAAWLLGTRSEDELDAARQWGQAIRRLHMLARLGQDARAGWVHVPIDVLQRFEVKAHQLVKPQRDQLPPGWPALLAHLHGEAQASVQAARQATRALPRAARLRLRPLAILGAIHAAQGQAVAMAGATVLFERITLTPLRKAWAAQTQAWRLWWGA